MNLVGADELGRVMRSEIAEIPEVLSRLNASPSQFESIRTLLRTKQFCSVLILARGTSDNAAHFLKYLIETQLGLPVGLTSPSSVTIYHSQLHFSNTLLIAISQSGQSIDLVEYARSAKASGAKLISITNDSDSPLAQIADHHISLLAEREVAVAATKSYAAQLFASLLLVEAWGKTFNDKQSIIDESKKLLSANTSIMHAVELCQRSQEIVILGRGFSYPNAREMALKIQETSKVSVQGLSIADYMHGPISALTKKTQVFIFLPHGMPLLPLENEVERIRNSNAQIYWVGSGVSALENEVVLAGASCENEIYSSIADAIVLQSFALEFALKNGLNPDRPVGLKKVTLTR